MVADTVKVEAVSTTDSLQRKEQGKIALLFRGLAAEMTIIAALVFAKLNPLQSATANSNGIK